MSEDRKRDIGIKSSIPVIIKPMLCTLVREPFIRPNWIFEIKWDGYRIVAFKNKSKLILRSRSGLDYTARYKPIVDVLKKINHDFVIDGEMVAFDDNGNVSFDAVQGSNPTAALSYCVFDILWKDGYSFTEEILSDRKLTLKKIIPSGNKIKYSEDFSDGIALFEQAEKLGIEGIVAKDANSIYQQGKCGDAWLKNSNSETSRVCNRWMGPVK